MSADLSPVAVVGLGRIGLPLAAQYASRGLEVTGCDIDAALVKQIAEGNCPYPDEESLEETLRSAHAAGRLTATTDTMAAVARSRVVVIIVPVGLTADNRADFTALDDAAQAVAAGLRPDTLVILETTVPAGTTRNRLGPLLERSGLRVGRDILLAYSPERVFVGRVLADLRTYPKVVGGVDEASTRRAAAFYEGALDAPVRRVGNCETAEFVKLAETTYRDVNIALANELARAADRHGVDVVEAIAAANSQPFSHIHQPGVGVGGHCIPVYPYFLLEGAEEAQLPQAARRINDAMARYAVERLARALGELSGRTVLILGLSYRPNIKEAAYSSTLLLARELAAAGARVLVHDPHYSADEIGRFGLKAPAAFPPAHTDALIIQASHDEYRDLDLASFPGCSVVLDGRNALSREKVEALGLRYLGIGR
jgi:nucleotide sugar dehydrogenase